MVGTDPRIYPAVAFAALLSLAAALWVGQHRLAIAASLIALLAAQLWKRASGGTG